MSIFLFNLLEWVYQNSLSLLLSSANFCHLACHQPSVAIIMSTFLYLMLFPSSHGCPFRNVTTSCPRPDIFLTAYQLPWRAWLNYFVAAGNTNSPISHGGGRRRRSVTIDQWKLCMILHVEAKEEEVSKACFRQKRTFFEIDFFVFW